MPILSALPSHRLHATCDPKSIPYADSRAIPLSRQSNKHEIVFQPRAMRALELALQITERGYNVYLSGEVGLARSHKLLSWLRPRAKKIATPPDLVYVQNFADPDCPILIPLPPGEGQKLKHTFRKLIEQISDELRRRWDGLNLVRQRSQLQEDFQKIRLDLLQKMNTVADHRGFNLDMDENGVITLYPVKRGKRLSEEEYAKLDNGMRLEIKRKGDSLARMINGYMRELNKAEEAWHDGERDLERQLMIQVLDSLLSPATRKILKACVRKELDNQELLENYCQNLREDLLKNIDAFSPRETLSPAPIPGIEQHPANIQENQDSRYGLNVFVDNGTLKGAPILIENNPTAFNLLGCVEKESEMGALVTDFTLIRAGSLQKANGGFLVLKVEDLLQHPNAWEGLLRALLASEARIEDHAEAPDASVRTKGLRPYPLALAVKVILIGNEDTYEGLLLNDERFGKLFRLKAQLSESTDRNHGNIRLYLAELGRIINDSALLPFDRSALAWLIDLGSHFSEDQKKLSLKFSQIREIMLEGAALAQMRNKEIVSAEILEDAYAARCYRSNLIEEAFIEDYDRGMIKVATSGTAIGQVNGISVSWNGDFEFGLPHRISCTVGVGHDGIIDLEREAELGGPIHTKAMMILKSYLTDLFARKKPLTLSASLYFEQSYAGIEGDSASGAELAALLSALAEVPLRLDLAFTGAVSHSGQIMAVGSVTRKVEGFFKVCARHGLTGTQGVIIPKDNIDHLMLAPEVLQAVDKGKFAIYAVSRIEDALQLLSNLPAGRRHKDGRFSKGSLYDLADKRLEKLGFYALNAFKRGRRDE